MLRARPAEPQRLPVLGRSVALVLLESVGRDGGAPSSSSSRSRCTFATIGRRPRSTRESASPWTIGSCGHPDAGNAHRVDEQDLRAAGRAPRPPAASPRGSRAGCRPRRSVAASTTPTPTATARRRISRGEPRARVRVELLGVVEARKDAAGGKDRRRPPRPARRASRGPTSSTPAMRVKPRPRELRFEEVEIAQTTQLREQGGERIGRHVRESAALASRPASRRCARPCPCARGGSRAWRGGRRPGARPRCGR